MCAASTWQEFFILNSLLLQIAWAWGTHMGVLYILLSPFASISHATRKIFEGVVKTGNCDSTVLIVDPESIQQHCGTAGEWNVQGTDKRKMATVWEGDTNLK